MKIYLFILTGILALSPAHALSPEQAIQRIKSQDKNVLATIGEAEMQKLHQHNGVFFYIPRIIGQPAIRSLFGCMDNKSSLVRKICADSLYQMKLNYVHKKFVLFLLKKEEVAPVKMALQDIIVRMKEERFYDARAQRDGRYLMKITYDELSVIADKGVPASKAFDGADFIFLAGGLENTDDQVRLFCVKMLGRIKGFGGSMAKAALLQLKKKEKTGTIIREIDISLTCLGDSTTCPDIYLQDGNNSSP